VLVCGSRTWGRTPEESREVYYRVWQLPLDAVIVHGGARGADGLAADAARLHGYQAEEFLPDWERHGKRAGILRNLAMLDTNPDLVIAFWDGQSKGTGHTITEAQKRGIPVEVITCP